MVETSRDWGSSGPTIVSLCFSHFSTLGFGKLDDAFGLFFLFLHFRVSSGLVFGPGSGSHLLQTQLWRLLFGSILWLFDRVGWLSGSYFLG